MENYGKVLKRRINILSICMLLIGCIIVYDQFFSNESLKNNQIYEFQIGMLVGLSMIGVVYITRVNRILNDEKMLQIAYNNENDERRKAIRQKSGLPVVLYTSIAMLVAGIIAGYFNIIVFYTLVAVALCQMTIACILKLIYQRRM